MTPKEKAEDLIIQFWELDLESYEQYRCALIAVNEVIEMLKKASDLNMLYRSEICVFYQEVKQEIENK